MIRERYNKFSTMPTGVHARARQIADDKTQKKASTMWKPSYLKCISLLISLTLNRCISDLERVSTTKLLLNVGNDTHLGVLVSLDAYSHL